MRASVHHKNGILRDASLLSLDRRDQLLHVLMPGINLRVRVIPSKVGRCVREPPDVRVRDREVILDHGKERALQARLRHARLPEQVLSHRRIWVDGELHKVRHVVVREVWRVDLGDNASLAQLPSQGNVPLARDRV